MKMDDKRPSRRRRFELFAMNEEWPMRGEALYKQTFNAMLDALRELKAKSPVSPEAALARRLGASRTTVRKVLVEMSERGLVSNVKGEWLVARRPRKSDFFPVAETVGSSARVEKKFMD